MYSRELWISVCVCFRGGRRKSYVFRVFLTKLLRSAAQCVHNLFLTMLLRSAQCVLRGRAPSLIRVVLGATQTSYYSDRSSRSRELGVVGAAAESFIQLGRQPFSTATRLPHRSYYCRKSHCIALHCHQQKRAIWCQVDSV